MCLVCCFRTLVVWFEISGATFGNPSFEHQSLEEGTIRIGTFGTTKNCSWEAVSGHILHGGASARISRAMENNYISTNAAACAAGRLSDLCVWCDLHCGGYRTLAG